MFWNRFLCALLIVGLGSPAMAASRFRPAECAYLRQHDAQQEYSFLQHFLYMVHRAEHCRTGKNCKLALNKFPNKVLFGGKAKVLSSDPKAREVILSNLNYMEQIFERTAGVSVEQVETYRSLAPMIRYHIASRQEILAERAAELAVPQNARRLVRSTKSNCFAQVQSVQGGQLFSGVIWIPYDARKKDYDGLAACIKEEFLNISGLLSDPIGTGSIFHRDNPSGSLQPHPIYKELSERDRLMLKLLYRSELKPGMGEKQTSQIAGTILRRECGI